MIFGRGWTDVKIVLDARAPRAAEALHRSRSVLTNREEAFPKPMQARPRLTSRLSVEVGVVETAAPLAAVAFHRRESLPEAPRPQCDHVQRNAGGDERPWRKRALNRMILGIV